MINKYNHMVLSAFFFKLHSHSRPKLYSASPRTITCLLPCNFFPNCTQTLVVTYINHNWASEASPTLGCSIVIYVRRFVCLRLSMGNPYKKFVCQNASEGLRGPNSMLKVSFRSLK